MTRFARNGGAAPIDVLHVDDEPDFADLAATFIERQDDRMRVETATSPDAGLEILADPSAEIDCIVSDYEMPGTNGIEFLEMVREQYPELPFILFTGKGSEEVASDAITAGVTDYLQKETGTDQYAVLGNRIANAVESYRSRQALTVRNQELHRYEQLVNSMLEAAAIYDAEGNFEMVNDYLAEWYGTPQDELVGEESTLISLVRADHDGNPYRDLLEGKRTELNGVIEGEFPGHGYAVLEYRFTPLRVEGSIEKVVGVTRDITAQTEYVRQLDTLIDNLPGMVFRCRNERGWPMESVRGEVETLTGYPAETIEAQEDFFGSEIIHDDDREFVWETVQDAVASDETYEVTYRIRTKHDETKWVRERGQLIDYGSDEGPVLEGFITDITQQETMRQELEAENEFVEQALDALDDLFCIVDPDGRIRRWNEQFTEVTGYTDAEIETLSARDLFPEDELERGIEAFEEALTTGSSTIELDLLTTDGTRIPHEITATRLTETGDETEGVVAIARDVSDREERLRELERRDEFLDHSSDIITVVEADGTVAFQSASTEGITGFSPDAIAGSNGLEHVHPDDREKITDVLLSFVNGSETEATVELRVETDEGDWRWVESRGVNKLDDPVIDGVIVSSRDITRRKRREQKLTALHGVASNLTSLDTIEEVCRRTIEASLDILEFDLSVIDIEEGGVLKKMAVSGDLPIDNMTNMSVDEGVAGKTYRTGETFLVDDIDAEEDANPQGPYKSVLSVPIGTHGVFQAVAESRGAFDDTDRELAELLISHTENALDRLDRERELERQKDQLNEFASVVSHDLRNPLNVAQGRLALAREDGDPEDEHLEQAKQAIDRSLDLIGDVLSLAREGLELGSVESVPMPEVLDGCWQNVETDDATLEIETERVIRADRSRLKQLLENLLANAVEHGGPDVTVTVGDLDGGFYLEDDGPGIPEADRETVFDPGYSTSEDGTGFGLSIVERIAMAHGWRIAVTEAETGGARFEFTGVEFVD